MWEREDSVRYSTDPDTWEREPMSQEGKDREDRSWQMLEGLGIELHRDKKPFPRLPRPKPRGNSSPIAP